MLSPWKVPKSEISPSLSPMSSIPLSLSLSLCFLNWLVSSNSGSLSQIYLFALLYLHRTHTHTRLLNSCQHTWSPSLTLTLSEPQICCMMCVCCGNPVWEERQRSSSNASSIWSIGRGSNTLVLSAPSIFSLLTFKRAEEETREEGRGDL